MFLWKFIFKFIHKLCLFKNNLLQRFIYAQNLLHSLQEHFTKYCFLLYLLTYYLLNRAVFTDCYASNWICTQCFSQRYSNLLKKFSSPNKYLSFDDTALLYRSLAPVSPSIIWLGVFCLPINPPTTQTFLPNCLLTSLSVLHARLPARLHEVETKGISKT